LASDANDGCWSGDSCSGGRMILQPFRFGFAGEQLNLVNATNAGGSEGFVGIRGREFASYGTEPRMAPGGFVKKFLSLSSLATLAIVLGMISWGSTLNAQTTPSTTDQTGSQSQSPDATPSQQSPSQQTPSTQQPPSPEMPPSSQQTPSSQSGSQSPDPTGSQSGSQSPDATTPRTQSPSSQSGSQSQQSGSQSQTPDATTPESGSRTGSSPNSGAAAGSGSASTGDTAGGAQTFTGTVVKQGDKYVLKDDAGKTYDIDHQTDVAKFEGKRVRVQGQLDPSGKIMVK
jgi:hypothetical protein